MPGSARLAIIVPVAIISFFYTAVLDYALPLYFSALSEATNAGNSYPADIWSQLVKYQITAWIIGPFVAGLLARRYGERMVWCAALLAQVVVPLLLAFAPSPQLVPLIAVWQGVTAALTWTACISLFQMVAVEKRGVANSLLLTALGVGSVFGPIGGRFLLYHHELLSLAKTGAWTMGGSRLVSLAPMATRVQLADFRLIFLLLAGGTLLCGLLVGIWGQHIGRFEHLEALGWSRTLRDVGRLALLPKFWALALTLCLLGGLTLQASNQFLPYRAEDLGLKNGAQDSGWIWLQLLKTLMWLLGGIATGYFAGRRMVGVAAVIMLASSALAALAIGLSRESWQLFAAVGVFEFVRQFVRWLNSGYLAEQMPGDLRATALGFGLTIAGVGSTIFSWSMAYLWDPTLHSALPFLVAAMLGGLGCMGLFVFDRRQPLRQSEEFSSANTQRRDSSSQTPVARATTT